MRIYLFILVCSFWLISCDSLQRQTQSDKSISIDLKSTKPNESVLLDKDTVDLYYSSNKEFIVIKIARNQKLISDKKLTKDDFIEDAVQSKESLSIDRLTSNGFDKNSNSFVFTIKFKSSNSKYSDIEAGFSIDLKGEFDLQQD